MITCAALLLQTDSFSATVFRNASERTTTRARAAQKGGRGGRVGDASPPRLGSRVRERPGGVASARGRRASLSSVAPSDGSVAESASRRRGRGEAPRVGGAERPERPRGHAGGGRGAHVPRRRDVRGRRRRARVPLLERPGRTGEPRRRRWRRNRPHPLVRAARAETVSASPRALRRGGAPRGRRSRRPWTRRGGARSAAAAPAPRAARAAPATTTRTPPPRRPAVSARIFAEPPTSPPR